MKQIIFSIAILISIQSFGQSANDSAYTKNLPLQARLVVLLIPKSLDPANDSLYTVFLKWRTSLRTNPVSGTTTISIDTIPTVELANLYAYTLGLPAGLGIGALMKPQLASARTANPYLDRLCTAIESNYTDQLTNMILIGRKLLLGR